MATSVSHLVFIRGSSEDLDSSGTTGNGSSSPTQQSGNWEHIRCSIRQPNKQTHMLTLGHNWSETPSISANASRIYEGAVSHSSTPSSPPSSQGCRSTSTPSTIACCAGSRQLVCGNSWWQTGELLEASESS